MSHHQQPKFMYLLTTNKPMRKIHIENTLGARAQMEQMPALRDRGDGFRAAGDV